jgi:hypothetical protein
MKQKATLSDINLDNFDSSIRNDVRADIATAQSLLDFFDIVSNIISRLKSILTSVFSRNNKCTEANAA